MASSLSSEELKGMDAAIELAGSRVQSQVRVRGEARSCDGTRPGGGRDGAAELDREGERVRAATGPWGRVSTVSTRNRANTSDKGLLRPQAEKVRNLKKGGAEKAVIDAEVEQLKALKLEVERLVRHRTSTTARG